MIAKINTIPNKILRKVHRHMMNTLSGESDRAKRFFCLLSQLFFRMYCFQFRHWLPFLNFTQNLSDVNQNYRVVFI